MELVPISSLPPASKVNSWDIYPVVQDGITKYASIDMLPGASANPYAVSSSGSLNMALPAGKLLASFVVRSTNVGAFTLRSSSSDILVDETVAANQWQTYNVSIYGGDAGAILNFSNLPGTFEIKLFLL